MGNRPPDTNATSGSSSGEDIWWEDTPYLRGTITVGIVEGIEFFFHSQEVLLPLGAIRWPVPQSVGQGQERLSNYKSLSRDGCRCNDVESILGTTLTSYVGEG